MSPPEGLVIDHINTKSWDNRFDNLRVVTQKINTQHRKISSVNTTGVTGVRKMKVGNDDYYRASIVETMIYRIKNVSLLQLLYSNQVR